MQYRNGCARGEPLNSYPYTGDVYKRRRVPFILQLRYQRTQKTENVPSHPCKAVVFYDTLSAIVTRKRGRNVAPSPFTMRRKNLISRGGKMSPLVLNNESLSGASQYQIASPARKELT